ncbi:MAG: biopolymer transporter ExbD [Kiritimatiellales bacterium]
MKFRIPTEGGEDSLNMAPMIDMVFLLLIFFMAASHLTKIERVPVELPTADNAKVPENTGARQIITLLAVDDSGKTMEIFMNQLPVEMKEFGAAIEKATNSGERPVYLRVDRRLRHRNVRQVMAACADAGIADVIFGALESGK